MKRCAMMAWIHWYLYQKIVKVGEYLLLLNTPERFGAMHILLLRNHVFSYISRRGLKVTIILSITKYYTYAPKIGPNLIHLRSDHLGRCVGEGLPLCERRRPFHEVWTLDVKICLIAQMKAYSMLIRNLALIRKLGHLCK